MKILLTYSPRTAHARALATAAGRHTLEIATSLAEAKARIVNADAVMGNRFFLQTLPLARQLRWMQSASVGVDRILREAGSRLDGVVLTCARGIYDDELAEHTLALILGLLRGLHVARDLQRATTWKREPTRRLSGRMALLLGWGGVARAVAAKLACFGVQVIAVCRNHASAEPAPEQHARVVGPATWRNYLAQSDLVIACLPLTEETRNLVGTVELAALPPGAFLVNVGRGGTVDERAVRNALTSGRLAGAALDVFAQEPLPQEHWLWRETRVLMTAHWGRSEDGEAPRWEDLFVENLRRFCVGSALLNVVDREAGY